MTAKIIDAKSHIQDDLEHSIRMSDGDFEGGDQRSFESESFDEDDNLESLKAAIQAHKTALAVMPLGHPKLPGFFQRIADAYTTCYYLENDEDDVKASFIYYKAAADCTLVGDPDLPDRLENLGVSFIDLYQESDEVDDLDTALHYYKSAIHSTAPGSSALSFRLWGLSVAYIHRFHALGHLADLDSALGCSKVLVAGTPLGHLDLSDRLRNLSLLNQDRYQKLGNLADIEASIIFGKAAVACTPPDEPSYRICQLSLAEAHTHRFQRLGLFEDLEPALQLRKVVVQNTSPDDPDLPSRYEDLGISYTNYYHHLGELNNLELALKYKKLAVAGTPLGHSGLGSCLRNLAVSYRDYFQRMGNPDDLEHALRCGIAAVENTPSSHSTLPGRQQSLATSYTDRYQLLGNLDDLEAALEYDKAAVAGTPAGHPDLPARQQSLAVTFTDQFERLGNLDDLEASIQYGKAATDNTPSDHIEFSSRKRSLAASYLDRFQRLGDLKDLDATLMCSKAALDKLSPQHPDYPVCQVNLAISYTHRYRRLGKIQDLENALQWNIAAVANTSKDHPALLLRQRSLAQAYTDHYLRLGALVDLHTALQLGHEIIKKIPAESCDLAGFLNDLAASYAYCYERLGEIDDLETALQLSKEAVNKTPQGDIGLSSCQQHLAGIYIQRYHKLGELSDLEAAVKWEQVAVDGTPAGHVDLPSHLQTLAVSHTVRYQRLGEMADLRIALDLNKKAVDLLKTTQSDSPTIPVLNQSLAYLYEIQYQILNNKEDHLQALLYSKASLHSSSAAPGATWNAALYMAYLHLKDNLPDALIGYRVAFDLIPQLLWIGSALTTRHGNLIEYNIANNTSSAVAAAIHFGNLRNAVEFLEQGLSITHQQSLQLKNHDIQLYEQYPDEAGRLQDISTQLSQVGHTNTMSLQNRTNSAINYGSLAVERENLIQMIRTYPGFSKFLLPNSYNTLCSASEYGPIIMLNCSLLRSDAIIILQPSLPPISIQLHSASPAEVNQYIAKLRSALRGYYILGHELSRFGRPADDLKGPSPLQQLQYVLSWLWTVVVGPVFNVLKQNDIHQGRIWWCTSGIFNHLPVHAGAPPDSPFIQSYTSTIEGLINARKRAAVSLAQGISGQFTVIGVAEIPGQPELQLPMVKKELDIVTSIWGTSTTQLLNSNAVITTVVEQMKASSWLHLACHGHQDDTDALKSGLLLSDGKLELGTIINTDLPAAKFVFLSACETAMGDVQLVNEAMHLTGGFILAGFQGAIGTLWSMGDSEGPQVAEIVYQKVFEKTGEPDVTLAAEGLHNAIQKLRKEGSPLHRWMPFVHFGI